MQTFTSLYQRLIKAGVGKHLDSELLKLNAEGECDPYQLDCLLKPKMHVPSLLHE